MGEGQEAKKTNKEVADCHAVVAAINRRDGSDYAAYPCETEPADVILKSASGFYQQRQVQVVTVPAATDEEPEAYVIRSDNKNVARFREHLRTTLLNSGGLSGAHIGILVQKPTARGRVPPSTIATLAAAITEAARTADLQRPKEMDWGQLFAVDQEAILYVCKIATWRDASIATVCIQTPGLAANLPPDGRWIWSGIENQEIRR